MKCMVTTPDGEKFAELDVSPDEEIVNVKAIIEAEVRILLFSVVCGRAPCNVSDKANSLPFPLVSKFSALMEGSSQIRVDCRSLGSRSMTC